MRQGRVPRCLAGVGGLLRGLLRGEGSVAVAVTSRVAARSRDTIRESTRHDCNEFKFERGEREKKK